MPANVLDDVDAEEEEEDLTDKAEKRVEEPNQASSSTKHPQPLDRRRDLTPAHNIPILPHLPKYSIIIHKSSKETLG